MDELVIMHDKQVVTTSLKVAEIFEKEHRDVMKSIRNLTAQNFAVKKMFVEDSYLNSRNQQQPMFYMNRDGFTLLAMGLQVQKLWSSNLNILTLLTKWKSKLKKKHNLDYQQI